MANRKIGDVQPINLVLGTFKIPCSIGDTNAHTITIASLLGFVRDNIGLKFDDLVNAPKIPSKVSELSNDVGYTTIEKVINQGFLKPLTPIDVDDTAKPFKVANNTIYRVKNVAKADIIIENCDNIVPSYIEVLVADALPNLIAPRGCFVSGEIDERQRLYMLKIFYNTIEIKKFRQI